MSLVQQKKALSVTMERPTPKLNLPMTVKKNKRYFTSFSYANRIRCVLSLSSLNYFVGCFCYLAVKLMCIQRLDFLTWTPFALKKRESKAHIFSSMNFANFGIQELIYSCMYYRTQCSYETIRKILLRLINAVCFLGKQRVGFRESQWESRIRRQRKLHWISKFLKLIWPSTVQCFMAHFFIAEGLLVTCNK